MNLKVSTSIVHNASTLSFLDKERRQNGSRGFLTLTSPAVLLSPPSIVLPARAINSSMLKALCTAVEAGCFGRVSKKKFWIVVEILNRTEPMYRYIPMFVMNRVTDHWVRNYEGFDNCLYDSKDATE